MKTFTQIREWAEARNLIAGSDSFRQLAKLVEETGELAADISRGRPRRRIADSIGDVRQPIMKMLVKNKGGALVQAVKDSENIIRHCDSGTGFSCFNWTKHFKRAANLIGLMRQEAAA